MRGQVNKHVRAGAHRAEVGDRQERLRGRPRVAVRGRSVRRGCGTHKRPKRVEEGSFSRSRHARVRELTEGGHEQRPALLEDEHGDNEAYNRPAFKIRVTSRKRMRLTSDRIEREVREPPIPKDRDERDRAPKRVAPVVYRIGHEDRAALLVRDAFRDAVQPLLRKHAHRREPRRVRVQRAIPVPMAMAVGVDVCVLGCDGRHGLSDVKYTRQDVVQRARSHRRSRSGQDFHEERPRMETYAEGPASEQDGDEGRAEHLELAVPVRVLLGRGLARETPAEERDEVPDEVFMWSGEVLQLTLSWGDGGKEENAPPRQCPASARSAAEFMYQPAAPFAPVRTTLDASPTRVILLPRSPAQVYGVQQGSN